MPKNLNKLVSIVVPIYNSERYLKRCVQSILEQSYRSIELILVNDGSVDTSVDICNEFAATDKRVTVVSQDNAGVSSARNHGIDMSRGKFIMFVDSDDALAPKAIELLLSTAIEYDADIVSGKIIRINPEQNNDYDNTKKTLQNTGVEDQKDSLSSFLDGQYDPSACARIYRMNIAKKVRFDTNIMINEDKLFIFKSFYIAKTHVVIPDTVYRYFQLQTSVSHSGFTVKYLDIEKVADTIRNVSKKKRPELVDKIDVFWVKSLIELYVYISLSQEARLRHRSEYTLLRNKIIQSNIKPPGSVDLLKVLIIKYAPMLFIPMSYVYYNLFIKNRRA